MIFSAQQSLLLLFNSAEWVRCCGWIMNAIGNVKGWPQGIVPRGDSYGWLWAFCIYHRNLDRLKEKRWFCFF